MKTQRKKRLKGFSKLKHWNYLISKLDEYYPGMNKNDI